MKFRVSKDNYELPPSGVHTGSLVCYVDLGWHKDEKFGGAKQHASLTFEIADITTADGHTYAEFGAMFIELSDIITWGIECDGRPTYEVGDDAVAGRVVERHQVGSAEAIEAAKWFLFQLEAGGARRVHAPT